MFWRTDEGVCPYRLACSLNKGMPSLFANSRIYSPLHSERGWG
ncbi:hypothetical protein HMPREF0973_02535 [Prevotella veroralis F0319]|uniref:Uncharacterized protein n=1 Tax=Prevotella veroralis F0319 TaxID=649761 RepID=C9MSB7_9BACT|nr:hypothetical protein HMPREF0973_02535 [Prevotella veroralis F0319]